jgi:Pyridoxamine 5'-phosphate oxidase
LLTAVPGRESRPPRLAACGRALRTLSPAECFGLLELGGVGRVGFASADGIMMLPVNFAVAGKGIIFRTAPDTLLALYASTQVSFEVDHLDEALREGWSVLVHGHAHTITGEREVRRLEDSIRLLDSLSAGFFSQVGVDASTTPATAATALQGTGDQMLQAFIFHSDNLELGEQFDATTGYEKSVSNLSWS